MVLFNSIEMIFKKIIIQKCNSKNGINRLLQHFKNYIKRADTLKIYIKEDILYSAVRPSLKKFSKIKRDFFSIDEDVLISSSNLSKKLPFEDNSRCNCSLHGLNIHKSYLLMRKLIELLLTMPLLFL